MISEKMELNSTEILKRAWREMSGNIPLFAALTAVFGVVIWVSSMIPFLSLLISAPLGFGLTVCIQKLRKNENFGFEDFFWGFLDFNRYLHGLIYGALTTAGIFLGFLLLIVPGVWFVVAVTFASVIFVVQKQDGVEAIKKSLDLVRGRWWNIAGFLGWIFVINFLGAICFVIGLLVTAPLSALAMILATEALLEEDRRLQSQTVVQVSHQTQDSQGSGTPIS